MVVPRNYASRLIGLRRRLRLTQAELAQRIGAANKAVIYQWETRRRIPSITFSKRVEELTAAMVSSS
jgi:DNA-binding XRE family transcriptional regulator